MLNDIYQAIDPVAFSVFGLDVRWYGIAYLLGFALTALVVWRTCKHWDIKLDMDVLSTIVVMGVFGIILGGRLGYVLVYGDGYYWEHPELILAINKGGMSFRRGLIGALLMGIPAAKMTKIPYLTLADLVVIGAPIGLFFGRCANFINGELWGAVTDVSWGVVFGGSAGELPRHPSQLYEAILEGLVIFIVLFALSRRNNPPRSRGTFLGLFLVLYGVFRFSVEFVRQPDVQIGYLFGTDWVTMGQMLSVPLILVGIGVLIYALCAKKPQKGLPELPEMPDK